MRVYDLQMISLWCRSWHLFGSLAILAVFKTFLFEVPWNLWWTACKCLFILTIFVFLIRIIHFFKCLKHLNIFFTFHSHINALRKCKIISKIQSINYNIEGSGNYNKYYVFHTKAAFACCLQNSVRPTSLCPISVSLSLSLAHTHEPLSFSFSLQTANMAAQREVNERGKESARES